MLPEIDYLKIGQRIKEARLQKGLTQYELGCLVDCSNNHMSHIEIGQTKVSLTLLLRLSYALEKNLEYFLLDTPYVKKDNLIDEEIAKKLNQCDSVTLVAINRIIDVFLEYQKNAKHDSSLSL